uniref:O-fucosyltransferase family protein n=1 Tax=Anthurium amnicola TaxID=1678845 RepID=A0A1D1YQH5_9ARAE
MNGYSRLGNGKPNGGAPGSPGSSSPSLGFRGGKGGGFGGAARTEKLAQRFVYLFVSAVFRRKGVLLFAPVLYITGMLMYMGTLNLDAVQGGVGVAILKKAPVGSVYRSPKVFEALWPFMQADGGNSSLALTTSWHVKEGQRWMPCVTETVSQAELPGSNGFLIIEANGGLNQQRLSICDAVAVAGLLNATLVIPMFHLNSVWRDSSKFGEIFDEDYFIDTLRSHVRVVKELPEDVFLRFDNNISNIVNLRVKAWSSKSYYIQKVLPKLLEFGAIRIAPFSSRLAHTVPSDIQRLRCLSNYDALRFSQPIRMLAENMIDRMVRNSSISGGKYISVHLRFEKDMVAFSCCTYDGGKEEKHEMDAAREWSWRGKFKRPHRMVRPGAMRKDGKCPLTPLEVGMILRGMGFDNTTSVYVASGKIYKEEKYMAPLRQLFPLLETKYTLASAEELAPFEGHSSRMAALDYAVCLHSEVFLTTQGGNFPHFMVGHRRYLYGHAKTINPDKRKLVVTLDNPNIRWEKFKHDMREMLHRNDVKGIELRKPNASVYTFPMPDCMCQPAEE